MAAAERRRDSALKRLRRVNRSIAIGAVALAAVLVELAHQATPLSHRQRLAADAQATRGKQRTVVVTRRHVKHTLNSAPAPHKTHSHHSHGQPPPTPTTQQAQASTPTTQQAPTTTQQATPAPATTATTSAPPAPVTSGAS